MRIVSMEARRIRLESNDHRNHFIEVEKSVGIVIVRRISSDCVSRMLSFEGRTVAMYAPLGLGKAWDDARAKDISR